MPIPLPPPQPLPNRLSDFIAKLKKTGRTLRKTHSVVRAEVDALRRDYAPLTLPAYLSDYRKRVIETFGPLHPAANMFLSVPKARAAGLDPAFCCGLTSAEVGANKRRDRRRVIAHQHAQIPLDDPINLVHTALRILIKPEIYQAGPRKGHLRWPDLLVALVLLTGRRPVELALLGSLTPLKPTKPFRLAFDGQAKTRGAIGTQQGPYPIHLLAPTNLTLRAWTTLRANIPTFKSADHFHNVAAKPMFEAVTRYFKGFQAYDLRAVNGRLTYHLFAPANMTDLAWFQDQFGHSDTITSAFYQRYYIPKPTAWKKAFQATFKK